MPDFLTLMQWMQQHPWVGWFLFLAYTLISVVRERLVRAEPGGVIRGLLNFRKRRLEQMLTQSYLNENAASLVKRELRHRSLHQLTGLFHYRLQDVAVIFCDRYGLRARYLMPWRNWLKEHNGQIVFNKVWHRRCWYAFLVILFVSTLLLIYFVVWFARHYSIEALAPFIMLNVCSWWFPLLMVTAVPSPLLSREMEIYVDEFNEEHVRSLPSCSPIGSG